MRVAMLADATVGADKWRANKRAVPKRACCAMYTEQVPLDQITLRTRAPSSSR
jgi:hypothetical protein